MNSRAALRRSALLLAALTFAGVVVLAWQNRPESQRRRGAAVASMSTPALTPVPADSPVPMPELASAPAEDLDLVALFSAGGERHAMFVVTAPELPARRFTLAEGRQNEWLELRAIDLENGVVTALLRRPVMRNRNAGFEVIYSLKARSSANTPSPGAQ